MTSKAAESSETSRCNGPRGHWGDIARQWALVGPPLRPSAEDLGYFSEAIGRWASAFGAPRVLILGVTPEIYHLRWPSGSHLLAADHTQSMIDAVWPGPAQQALLADWTALPLGPATRDVAICDGGIHLLAYPEGHRMLARELRRVVGKDGLCILRLFVPPACRESPEVVLRDLGARRVSSLNVLKLRLGMAMQEDVEGGVRLQHVWERIHQFEPDFPRLAAHAGWPLDHLLAVNTYRNCPAKYCFLSVAEVCRLMGEDPGGFEVEDVRVPGYELGDRCPTLVLRRVSGEL
jgi:hypothetical protein